MGAFENFLVWGRPDIPSVTDVEASAPQNNPDAAWSAAISVVDRDVAMSVPSVARARNILCSTLAGMPIECYNKLNGAHIEPNRVINQPDSRVPGSYVYAWVAEDLLFRGVSYGIVMNLYSDGRISEWTRVNPTDVLPQYDAFGINVIGYLYKGNPTPQSGIGSLIVFYGLDEGVLARAGRTISAAHALEKAAANFAKNPVPQMALKSTGAMLTKERITKLLTNFNSSRSTNGTAFLNADVDLAVLGFDPAKMQLNEARQYVALEIARAMGISAYFLSAETTSMTYSNAVSERKQLIDFGLRHIATSIEQRLNMPDFTPSTVEVRYSYDDFLRGSALERAQVYQILNQLGAMSVEQIQQEEDLIK